MYWSNLSFPKWNNLAYIENLHFNYLLVKLFVKFNTNFDI